MEGWLYVMSNESLRPGLLKIGRSNDLRQHVKDLYTRGVAAPFKIAYRGLVEDYEEVEKKVHYALEDCRLSSERDFFECSIARAILTIQESGHIMSEDVYVKDEHQLEKEKETLKQKDNIKVDQAKIQDMGILFGMKEDEVKKQKLIQEVNRLHKKFNHHLHQQEIDKILKNLAKE